MASSIQLLRSTISQERPFPANLLEGQPAVNLNSSEPGLFFKAADGSLVKFGPVAITSDGSPPNSAPQGLSGNTIGELWLDKSVDPPVLKVYDGAAWIDAGSGGGGGTPVEVFLRWTYTSIGGETSLSGSSGGVLLEYTPGLERVFVNGVLISRGVDYVATNGTSISNLSPLAEDDVVTVISSNPLSTEVLPGQATLLRWNILSAAGQTNLSGLDTNGQLLAYSAGYEQVFVDGRLLTRDVDYTATDGENIVLASPLGLNSDVDILAYSKFEVGSLSISDSDVSPNARIRSSKLSYTGRGTLAAERSVREKLGDCVNVRDFGAKGDASTDDTDAIQAAIDFCQDSSPFILPKKIYFGEGTYRISRPLEVKGFFSQEGLVICGDNAKISSTHTGPALIIDGLGIPANLRANVRVENLNFSGPGKGVTGSVGISIDDSISATSDVWVKDCLILRFETGILCDNGIITDYQNVTFRDCALGFSSPNISNSLTFTSCRWYGCDKAIYARGFRFGVMAFNNCEIEGNSTGGTATDGVRCCEFIDAGQLMFNACHFESNDCEYNIFYDGAAAGENAITFVGCEVIAGLGNQVYANNALVTVIGSFVSSGISVNDIFLTGTCRGVVINSYTTVQGPGANNVSYLVNGASGGAKTSLRFDNRSVSLDDYDEDVWTATPANLNNCSGASITSATYTKVGRQVTVYGSASATVTSTGQRTTMTFELPVPAVSDSYIFGGTVSHDLTDDGIGKLVKFTLTDDKTVQLVIPASQVTVAGGSSFTSFFTMTYEAS